MDKKSSNEKKKNYEIHLSTFELEITNHEIHLLAFELYHKMKNSSLLKSMLICKKPPGLV